MEIHALNNSFYDLERSGAHFVASPHHDADLLPVTGPVSRQTQHALRTAYECTPGPKRVVAVGTCAKRRRIRRVLGQLGAGRQGVAGGRGDLGLPAGADG